MNAKIMTMAIAIYMVAGVIEALAYLRSVGFTMEDSVALLALWDDSYQRAKDGDYQI